jgi:hypothetical protein
LGRIDAIKQRCGCTDGMIKKSGCYSKKILSSVVRLTIVKLLYGSCCSLVKATGTFTPRVAFEPGFIIFRRNRSEKGLTSQMPYGEARKESVAIVCIDTSSNLMVVLNTIFLQVDLQITSDRCGSGLLCRWRLPKKTGFSVLPFYCKEIWVRCLTDSAISTYLASWPSRQVVWSRFRCSPPTSLVQVHLRQRI